MASWFSCSRSAARGQHVKLVFPGGQVELLDRPTLAAEVMARHPRFCVARPDVFREPAGAVTAPDTVLQLGHKYYVVPSSTVRRLLKYSSASASARSPGAGRRAVTLRAHLASEKGYKVGGRRWFRCLVGGQEAKVQRPHRRHERESSVDDHGGRTETVRERDVKGMEEDGMAPVGGSPVRRRRRGASPGNSVSYSWQPSLHSITEE
ncbi:hypothetical protein PR202_gb27741 [Eleusine coracana subsp. coracana]|uniref:Uncharacterized protein n=1 Tax=Eleusine coracana subsp. coracana TaxID=191504 RepID=A0AAV5FV75_ELECO|nr:hypothetical protein QOZ80_6AG0543360 [Eleusine coracana subsp. coracana]GJN38676.1 hypothetical protein PR202_gb27741 [Eleusine coracana subsp. coracana]